MRVLLTGASGFVGSHILDSLVARTVPTAILLRSSSDKHFIAPHLDHVEIRKGSITDPKSLQEAAIGVTHVIHCAGYTRACRSSEFYEVNETGTRNVLDAVNAQQGRIQRFVHISSLAAIGPATAARPATEDDPPHPVSEYGKSKLRAELAVRNHCRPEYVILRPPAVYGPRDDGFLPFFKAVKHHILPRTSSDQPLSFVFAKDLAEAVVTSLTHPAAAGRTYFIASPEMVTARMMAEQIASQMGDWTLPCPLPLALLWPICLVQEILSRLTGKAKMLNLQKFSELRAPGWVCNPSRIKAELGVDCATTLAEGISQAITWYRQERWL